MFIIIGIAPVVVPDNVLFEGVEQGRRIAGSCSKTAIHGIDTAQFIASGDYV